MEGFEVHSREGLGMAVVPRPNLTQQMFCVREETRPYHPKHDCLYYDTASGSTFYAAHRYSAESGIRLATQYEQDKYAYTREFLEPHFRPEVTRGYKLPCCNGLAYAVAHNLVPTRTESMPVGELLKHGRVASPVTVMEPLPAGMSFFTNQSPFRPTAVGNVQKKQTTKTRVYAGGSFSFDFSAAMPTDPTDCAGADQEPVLVGGEKMHGELSMDIMCFTPQQLSEIMDGLP